MCILRYVKCTFFTGLHLSPRLADSLTTYSNTDWSDCPDSRCSMSRYYVFFGDNLVSWSSKRQSTVSHSSAEAEYHAVAHAMVECCWLRQILQELYH